MHRLLTEMSPDRLAEIYRALPDAVRNALDGPIASSLNSRPASVRKRPEELKLKALRAYFVRKRDDDVAGDLLRAYLLGPRKELVTGFLDATGVPHEDGQIEGDEQPDPKKLPDALKAAREAHGDADVDLYLEIARRQWPELDGLQASTDPAGA
ncbi:MAG: hypothetical protein DHS20C15_21820 [Planctomycetota bacterium]|nr:MAG: hypothetical protein DHS20C15_21820 [Planctomycetota bacterium]